MHNSISFKVIKIKDYIISFLFILLFLLLVIFSNQSFNSAKKGIELFLYNVLPSIFPFLVISNMIINSNILYFINRFFNIITKKIFKMPGIASIPIILGIFSGYPVGAKITKDLYTKDLIDKNDANRLLAFTNNSGPLFIISFIGISLFHDTKTGILLFITHIISAIIVGIILSFFSKNKSNNYLETDFRKSNQDISNIFINSIKDSVNIVLLIGGFIVFFSVIINLLTNSCFFEIISKPINALLNYLGISSTLTISSLQGLVELTNGINNISVLKTVPYIYKVSIISFLLGIGGFSIYMQLKAIISNTDLSTKFYIIGKIVQAIISYVITFLLVRFTPFFNLGSIQTYVKPYTTVNTLSDSYQINILLDIITLFFIGIVLFRMYKINQNSINKKSEDF